MLAFQRFRQARFFTVASWNGMNRRQRRYWRNMSMRCSQNSPGSRCRRYPSQKARNAHSPRQPWRAGLSSLVPCAVIDAFAYFCRLEDGAEAGRQGLNDPRALFREMTEEFELFLGAQERFPVLAAEFEDLEYHGDRPVGEGSSGVSRGSVAKRSQSRALTLSGTRFMLQAIRS
jgi:hypothetical protein